MSSGISIRMLETPLDMARAEELQSLVWPESETDVVPAHVMLAFARNGGLAMAAFDGQRLVGLVLGFLGTDSTSPERIAMTRLKHCSHQLAVHPDYRDRGLGMMLKRAQRAVVIDQGIRLITWMCDPLLSRSAHLNIRRLGGVCGVYIREAYGETRDGLTAGEPSDRLQVDWWITSRRVATRLEGERRPLDLASFLAAGAQELNPATLGADGLPRPAASILEPVGNLALVEIPSDYLEIRRKDLDLALAWRRHTRQILEQALDRGYIVTDFVHLRGARHPRSFYLLSHGEATVG